MDLNGNGITVSNDIWERMKEYVPMGEDGDVHFGDWLAYAAPPREARSYPGATTGKDLIATAFFAHSTELLQRIAVVLGRPDDAARYGELASKVKQAFREEYVTARGRVGENTQTAYVLALQFDLLGEDVLITGAGPIGCIAAAVCQHAGARHVVITDIQDDLGTEAVAGIAAAGGSAGEAGRRGGRRPSCSASFTALASRAGSRRFCL